MNYPLISEYVEAIKAAEDNFDQLKHLRPVIGDDGEPVMTSGNFAVVFKMKDEQIGKLYALKCFTKEQEGRAEAYKLITEELATVDSPYILSIKYLEKELFVDTAQTSETEFPVLLMDWVEGKTLDKYLRENLDDKYALELLAYRFSQLAQWLIPQPFAHGDLKPDNILVREDGTLVLVDYDGMYVPAMKGQKARELCSPDFRHPLRTENDFDEHIDDFALLILTLTILIACESPSSFSFPILTDKDFHYLNTSQSLKQIYPSNNAAINKIVSTIVNCIIDNDISLPILIYDSIAKNIRWNYYIYAQNYYDLLEEQYIDDRTLYERFHRKGGFDRESKLYPVDGFDVEHEYAYNYEHSFYKGLLLSASDVYAYSYLGDPYEDFWLEMSLPSDTIVIGKEALSDCAIVELIVVPNSVKYVGDKAFYNCENLRYIVFPGSIEGFGTDIFNLKDSYVNSKTGNTDTQHYGKGAHSLVNIIVPNGKKEYYANLLPDYRHLIVDFSEIVNSKDSSIQSLFVKFEKTAESDNGQISTTVTDEDLSNAWTDEYGVKYSTDRKRLLKAPASIKEYVIKEGTIVICDWAFSEYMFINRHYLKRTIIDPAVNFYFINYRSMLSSIKIPNSITHIGVGAFGNCSKLLHLSIPDSVIFIGDGAFHNCRALSHVNIPTNLSRISRWLFLDCESLKDIILPYSVKSIGDGAFCNCRSFVINQLPNSITEIGKFAFKGCFGKWKKIYIPDALLKGNPFAGCRCKIEFDNNNRYKAYEESNGLSSILSTDGKVLIHCAYVDGETTLGFNEFNGGYEEGPYLVNNPYIFPEGIETIGYAAFASSQIGIIHIPYGVRKIENYAFYNDLITEVSLPPTINFIGKHVFNKDVISKIIIPKGSFAKFEKLLPDYKGWIVEDR